MFECKNNNSFISISQLFKVIKYFIIENDMCVNVDLLDSLNVYIHSVQGNRQYEEHHYSRNVFYN